MSSVLNTKPALEADLPVDMLLEIAYWCDYPELCNLMLALNNDKLIKNNELFWNKYFQRITSEDKNNEKLYRSRYDDVWKDHQQIFTNIEICKIIEMLKIIHDGKKTEHNFIKFHRKNGGVIFQIEKLIYKMRISDKEITVLLPNKNNNSSSVIKFAKDIYVCSSIGKLRTIIHYPKYGIFSMIFSYSFCDYNLTTTLSIDHANGVHLLGANSEKNIMKSYSDICVRFYGSNGVVIGGINFIR